MTLLAIKRCLGPTNPIRGGVDCLPQQQIQLGGAMLDMTHVVEEQFGEADFIPPVRSAACGLFSGQELAGFAAFFAAMSEIAEQFFFGVGAFGDHASRVELFETEWLRRLESLRFFREIKIEPEQCMEGAIPEILAAPKLLWASNNSVFEHVNRRAKLPPDYFSEITCHNGKALN